MSQTNQAGSGIFSTLYRTRIKLTKGNTPIVNLSLLFCIFVLLTAPWVVIIGAIVALILGYRFGAEQNAADFGDNLKNVVGDAASKVKSVVNSVVSEIKNSDEDPKGETADAGTSEDTAQPAKDE